jgi:NDP-sugar pyrophosphorylase family protein
MGKLTDGHPKPMLSVAGRPILEILITNAIRSEITDFTIHRGYLGLTISDYFGNGDRFGTRIDYFDARVDGPAEAILEFGGVTGEERFCSLCADTLLSSQQISELIRTHFASGAAATFVREHGSAHVSPPVSLLANRVVRPGIGVDDVWVGYNGVVERAFLDAGRDIMQTKKVKYVSALMTALATAHHVEVVDLGPILNINTPEELRAVSDLTKNSDRVRAEE